MKKTYSVNGLRLKYSGQINVDIKAREKKLGGGGGVTKQYEDVNNKIKHDPKLKEERVDILRDKNK